MGNTRALELLSNSAEFDEKYDAIDRLGKILGSFVLRALPISKRNERNGPRFSREVHGGTGHRITLTTIDMQHEGVRVVFRFRNPNGDTVLSKAELDLSLVRHLYKNLDILVEMAEGCCLDPQEIARFRSQMARFGM